MSEINTTPEELVENIHIRVDDAPAVGIKRTITDSRVIPIPIDPTLTIEGEAADAKATGEAIASSVGEVTVNNKSQDANHNITVYATDIDMSNSTGAQTVAQAVEAVGNRTANEIMYDSENLITIKSALDNIFVQLDTDLTEEEIDEIIEEVFGGDD